MSLQGRVALVTGGSRGMGTAIAKGLAAAGADVALTYRSSASGEEAASVVRQIEAGGRRAMASQIDSVAPDAPARAIQAAMATFGRLDILVNNAGIFPHGPLAEVQQSEVDTVLALHVRAPYLFSQAAAAVMTDSGRIVTIGSSFGDRAPYPGVSLYAMSKAAVAGMTRGLARDLGERGITVNVIHPGNIDTQMNPADAAEAAGELPAIALGRYGHVQDIAAAVLFLAGEGGRYVTGTTLTVDGGYNA